MRMHVWVFGLAVTAGYVVGCNNQEATTPYSEADEAAAGHDEHEHHHEGPHGGHVIELSSDHSVHGEFVVDTEAQLARLYLLGEDLETPVEGTAATFHAEGDSGEEMEVVMQPAGGGEKASEFTAPLAELPSTDIEQLFGHFHVTIDGKEVGGSLEHDHDHDHGHEHEEHAE